MKGYRQRGRFTLFLVSFMLAMLGVVLSDNLVALFVFWELTTITSFLLIGYSHEDAVARRSALQGLLVTGAGALAMLAGFVVLGQAVGTFSLREMLAGPEEFRGPPPLHGGRRADHARGLHQVGAVSVPLLAAERDGGSHAGVGVPALGDDGQGRRVPAGSLHAAAGRDRALDADPDRRGSGDGGALGVRVAGQVGSEADTGLHHDHGARRVCHVPRIAVPSRARASRRGGSWPHSHSWLPTPCTRRPCS